MLFPKSTKTRLKVEHTAFRHKYVYLLSKMRSVMKERGEVRDVSTPIYYRRSPHDCLGLAKHKALRIESLLSKLSSDQPQVKLLRLIVEECIDASNYLLFIASLCLLILEDEGETPCKSHI